MLTPSRCMAVTAAGALALALGAASALPGLSLSQIAAPTAALAEESVAPAELTSSFGFKKNVPEPAPVADADLITYGDFSFALPEGYILDTLYEDGAYYTLESDTGYVGLSISYEADDFTDMLADDLPVLAEAFAEYELEGWMGTEASDYNMYPVITREGDVVRAEFAGTVREDEPFYDVYWLSSTGLLNVTVITDPPMLTTYAEPLLNMMYQGKSLPRTGTTETIGDFTYNLPAGWILDQAEDDAIAYEYDSDETYAYFYAYVDEDDYSELMAMAPEDIAQVLAEFEAETGYLEDAVIYTDIPVVRIVDGMIYAEFWGIFDLDGDLVPFYDVYWVTEDALLNMTINALPYMISSFVTPLTTVSYGDVQAATTDQPAEEPANPLKGFGKLSGGLSDIMTKTAAQVA